MKNPQRNPRARRPPVAPRARLSLLPPRAPGPRHRALTVAALVLAYTVPTVVFLHPIWASLGDRIVGRSGDPLFGVASAALALALAGELAPAAVATRPLRAEPDFPAAYQYLRTAGEVGAVLEIPRLKPWREALYMYYSTLHWRPIANGYSGYQPRSDQELRDRFQLLRQRGITHLVVHAAGPDGREIRERLPAWEDEFLAHEAEQVFADESDRVYRLFATRR
ncbi:MAG TPA: hypothetical protein VMW75_24795 [Thermoanaerobaculia bacterium]|nr:hypothetical protein [Thermoanaerobaculia bacterium]